MEKYNHKEIETKQQKKWWDADIDKVGSDPNSPKCYVLDMFPYPSGEGLHVGHPKGYIATDIYSRFKKMQGHNILHPMGWDAFGLPAENYALKNKIHPKVAVDKNIATFKEQLKKIGFNYDWEKEINTTDPEYYKWTQWIFLKMLEKGLAYESHEPINWCPSCQTGLANEDLEDGKCERCGSEVEKRPLRQWVLKITDYADRLLEDLDIKLLPNGDLFETYPNGEFGVVHMNTDQPGTVRPDMPFVERNVIAAFVEHWSEDKFLILKWKKVDWLTPITGGIESGQTAEEAARAEIFEETGFKNLNLIHNIPNQYHSTFFHVPKNVNRIGHFTAFHFKLVDNERAEVSQEEQDKHEFVWHSRDEVRKLLTAEGSKLGWDLVMEGKPQHEMTPLLNWPEYIKESQRNWIGRSEGAEIEFKLKGIEGQEDGKHAVTIFTTRADTIFGVTYLAISPEVADKWLKVGWQASGEVKKYIANTLSERAKQTFKDNPEKTGIFSGIYAINPANNEEVPVWITNYVLADVGTGAVMAVPAHDERDHEFAQKYNLPISEAELVDKEKIVEKVGGHKKVNYKLKDWVFSRQRYWGEPIPVIHCGKCGVVPVPEADLPVKLPEVEHYEPAGTGESPLANISEWVNVECPKCGGAGKRETNTMPQWAGSSWYYLAYACKNPKVKGEPPSYDLLNKKALDYWNPVDMYVGGAEHATRHLIYARFWHKFLYDLGVVSNLEPFTELHNVGLILAEDGRKMSKRFGNVVNPDEIVELYGADSLRLYEMFMGPFSDEISWSTNNIIGVRRFLEKVWRLQERVGDGNNDDSLHATVKKVTDDVLNFRFNTAISAMMIQVNSWEKAGSVSREDYETLLKLLAPFAPHIADELWEQLDHTESIHLAKWPEYDINKLRKNTTTFAIQINGKVRSTIELPFDSSEAEVASAARSDSRVSQWLDNKEPKRVIFVANRAINFIV